MKEARKQNAAIVRSYIHPRAEIAQGAVLGKGVQVWMDCQIREGAILGDNVIVGKGTYIDKDVHVGSQCKIQNHCSVFQGVTLEKGVFVGPHVCFTNDLYPRAVNPDGGLKAASDWQLVGTLVKEGASIGAGSVIVCGITLGRWSMVAAGSVVTRNVPDYALVAGSPATVKGYVCCCGKTYRTLEGAQSCPNCEVDKTAPLRLAAKKGQRQP